MRVSIQNFHERYKFEREKDFIGEGGFGTTYKAFCRIRKEFVAIKEFRGARSDFDLINEIQSAIRLNHINLIKYLEAYEVIFEDGRTVQVGVMEYADGGDMTHFLKEMPSDIEMKLYLSDILNGLVELERRKIIHRDIKLANILLKYDNDLRRKVAKISDFGIAHVKTFFKANKNSTSLRGTPAYMAPEVFDKKYAIKDTNGKKKFHSNLDLWAFGVLVYYLFVKKLPFGAVNDSVTPLKVLTNITTKKLPIYYIHKIPEPYKEITRKCLVKDANVRVKSAKELLKILNKPQTENSVKIKIINKR